MERLLVPLLIGLVLGCIVRAIRSGRPGAGLLIEMGIAGSFAGAAASVLIEPAGRTITSVGFFASILGAATMLAFWLLLEEHLAHPTVVIHRIHRPQAPTRLMDRRVA